MSYSSLADAATDDAAPPAGRRKTTGNPDRGMSPWPGSVVVAGQARDRHEEADMAGFNGVAWFEVGTDDPAGAVSLMAAPACRCGSS